MTRAGQLEWSRTYSCDDSFFFTVEALPGPSREKRRGRLGSNELIERDAACGTDPGLGRWIVGTRGESGCA